METIGVDHARLEPVLLFLRSPAPKHIRLMDHKGLANRGVKNLFRLRLRLAKTLPIKSAGVFKTTAENLISFTRKDRDKRLSHHLRD
ncbi:hypothetical protein GB937_003007 [Aspergillus fischeri]|nr:hypothetical protein GB937_003007 [Aspergillus fischeri]